ncbi:MAG: butyrate kinase [Sarcina sp.]
MSHKLLIINPGSTSTKISVFENKKELLTETLRHETSEIQKYKTVSEQLGFRKEIILDILKRKNFDINNLTAVVGRGGMLKPMAGGTYEVNEAMIEDLKIGVQGEHASNLGGILASDIANAIGKSSYIVDPVVVDELEEIARISGIPELPRKSKFHALNQKAVAKRYAAENGKSYEEVNLIVVHMGGGVSVGAHKNGKVIDVNNALDGEGPLSPERSGGVPVGDLVKLCFNGTLTEKEIYGKIVGKGGYVAYLNTNDARIVEDKSAVGEKDYVLLQNAFVYQVAKAIGERAVTLHGKVDSIILTGGIAYSKVIVKQLKEMADWIAPVTVYPGEDEMLALAEGTLRVLNGEEEVKIYK